MEVVEASNLPVKPKPRGRPMTKEHMIEIGKIGSETMMKKGVIRRHEKALKKKEIDDKFAMIQNELSKVNQPEPEQEAEVEPEIETEPVQKIQKKKKKIIIEEVEEETDDEEEVIVRRIIKKRPQPKQKNDYDGDDIPSLIQKSNIELLRKKYDDDMRQRIRSSLFDY